MAISFVSPSYRAASSDLTIAISPLGLVELADEEFEVHGPRLNRYASNWAFYLGHHWSYRREIGEPQLTFNWTRTFSDFMTNFVLKEGVIFHSPHATQAIIPELLRTVWEEHNPQTKEQLLWEIHMQGSVSGDSFVKIAWEEAYIDPSGMEHPGRIRILPLNSAFCLPVDENEILTKRGWLTADQVRVGDKALSLDPETDELQWAEVEAVNVFDWDGPMHEWKGKNFSALSTPDHRWVFDGSGERSVRRMRTSAELQGLTGGSLVLAGGDCREFPAVSSYLDEFVELVGWVATEGWFDSAAVVVGQDPTKNPAFCNRIEKLSDFYQGSVYERENGFLHWYFPVVVGREVQEVVSADKSIDPAFLAALTKPQAELLYNTLLDGDGDTRRVGGRERLYQSSWGLIDSFQMLAMMLGKRSIAKVSDTPRGEFGGKDGTVGVHQSRTANVKWLNRSVRWFTGRVWCPTTSTGTWVTRRKEVMPRGDTSLEDGAGEQGSIFKTTVYVTGNCFPE